MRMTAAVTQSQGASFVLHEFELWEQGAFRVERLVTFFDFDQIERAARDAESGATVKAVLRMH